MSDNLTIFGNVYEGVNTLTFTDTNNQQKVYINTADADATAEDIVSGKTAYVQGNKIIGTGSSGSSTASAPMKDVNFRDYDGTITNSYSKEEFATLTAMPANPTHEGLTAQGWNWSLADAKAYVAKYDRLEIGQMYITDDGKTRIYIYLGKGRTSPMLGVCPNGTVDVDWGDGTAHDTLTGTSTTTVMWTPHHPYASPGDYVIKLTVSGEMGFYGSSSNNEYSGLLRYTTSDDGRNMVYRSAIKKIEIGSGVTSIGDYAFYHCYSLTNVTIPDSVTNIGIYALGTSYSLVSVTIPDSITNIGSYAFYYCYSLMSVTIPDSVTDIGGYVFYNGNSLMSVTIPDSVTSIGSNAFRGCGGLANVTIPDGVTSIGTTVFYNCRGVFEYHLTPTTPPTLGNTEAFSGIPADCIIYVPYSEDQSILKAYKTATNWSNYANRMQEEPV